MARKNTYEQRTAVQSKYGIVIYVSKISTWEVDIIGVSYVGKIELWSRSNIRKTKIKLTILWGIIILSIKINTTNKVLHLIARIF